MNRSGSRNLCLAFAGLALTITSAVAAPAKLRTADQCLGDIERSAVKSADATTGKSDGAKLLADIERYRDESGSIAPAEAVARWFALYDRAVLVAPAEQQMDFAAYDIV